MSIAMSVVVRPSRLFRASVLVFSVVLLGIGVYVASLSHVSLLSRGILSALCMFSMWRCWVVGSHAAQRSHFVSVDGGGQLRYKTLTAQQTHSSDASLVKLLRGTTLWTRALFLRLHDSENKQTVQLIVFPDALSSDEFRRLSIACRWMVARL